MINLFEAYHKELAQSDRDPKTIARYWQVITSYQKWLGDRQPDVASAKEFLSNLRNKGYQPKSVILYYHSLRLFLWFIGQELKLKLRKPETLPPYYDRGDVEVLIGQAEKGLYHQTEKQEQRNKALILVLVYTGMRKSELLGLLVRDIDFNRRTILVTGKGRRQRIIPMANRIVVPLRFQCEGKGAQQRVFDNLNARSAYRIVTSLAKASGLEGFHVHSTRHFFATQLVETGANIRDIQKLLGHQDLNTTAQYLDVTAEHLRSAVDLLDSSQELRHLENIVRS